MRVRLVAAAVAAVLTFGIAGVAAAVSRDPAEALMALARTAAGGPAPALLRALNGTNAMSYGNDGRLTVLLLGSDTRAGGAGLTDTVMVFSVKGNQISAVSIPRDTARIPNPAGGTFAGRINSLLQKTASGRTLHGGLVEFERVMEHVLEIEIDHYALLRFHGFQQLVEEIEPIKVRVNKEVRDSVFWDDPDEPSGVYFPEANGYELYAWQPGAASGLCNGHWESQGNPIPEQYWCHRAMPFVRTRKGPSNSDFARANRQQDLVLGAIERVVSRGNGSALSALVSRAQAQSHNLSLHTNIPLTMANALDMYRTLDGANAAFRAVFSPPQYASHIGSGAYELDLAAVRRVMRDWFGSTGSPPSTPAPTTAPTPTGAPTPVPTPRPSATTGVTPGPTGTPRPSGAATPTATVPGSTPAPGTPIPTSPPGVPPGTFVPPAPGATPTPLVPSSPVVPASPGVPASPVVVPPLDPGSSPVAPGSSAVPSTPGAGPGATEVPAVPPVSLAPGETPPAGVPVGGSGGPVSTGAPGGPGQPGDGPAATPPAVAAGGPTPQGGVPGAPGQLPTAIGEQPPSVDYLPLLAIAVLSIGILVAAGLIWRLRRS